jgi:hypothetical protein
VHPRSPRPSLLHLAQALLDGGDVLEPEYLDASLKVRVEGQTLALILGGSPVGLDGLDGSVHELGPLGSGHGVCA